MLVVLMHLSQGETTTELPLLLQRIKKDTKTQIKTGNSEFKTIFDPPTDATTEMSTTATEAGQFTGLQNIIELPKRCPSDSDFIRGSCRKRID